MKITETHSTKFLWGTRLQNWRKKYLAPGVGALAPTSMLSVHRLQRLRRWLYALFCKLFSRAEESLGHCPARFSALRTLSISILLIFVAAVLLSVTATPIIPQTAKPAVSEIHLSLDPARSKLNWTVDSTLHMVHGTFNIKDGSVHFDSETGKASGEIIVLVTSGDTGNTSRDEKMHKEVLQSSQYPDAIFKPSQVDGHVSRTGASDVKLHGTLSLHGSEHDLVVPVHAELANDQWKGTAKFEVPYIQWGLKDPSNFLLKVKPIVNVELEMSGPLRLL